MRLKEYEVKIVALDGVERFEDVIASNRAEAEQYIRAEYSVLDYGAYEIKWGIITQLHSMED